MTINTLIIGDSSIALWGLTSAERIRRQIRQVRNLRLVDAAEAEHSSGPLLILHAAYLFEARTLQTFSEHENSVLVCAQDGAAAAALTTGDEFKRVQAAMAKAQIPEGLEVKAPEELAAFDMNLRRSEPPLLESLALNEPAALESKLYGNAYKGVTDLVTKWWWPRPARHVVAWCAQLGITPNAVTLTGVGLMLAACWCFAYGYYALGLAAGWIMTFLDTVDGKLARVTVQSSRFGHVLDHGMDLLHPPFWYVIWGVSLVGFSPPFGWDAYALPWWIFGGYAVGRIAEGLFQLLFTWGIFTWRPFDSYFRLVTARRNPNMILLTASVLIGRPDWGYLAVLVWTVLTSGVLVLRLLQALFVRITRGPLTPWLTEPDAATGPNAKAFRTFSGTKSAYES